MNRDDVFRRMRERGYTWDGAGEDDPEGWFIKESGGMTWSFDQAVAYLLQRPPEDELRG